MENNNSSPYTHLVLVQTLAELIDAGGHLQALHQDLYGGEKTTAYRPTAAV